MVHARGWTLDTENETAGIHYVMFGTVDAARDVRFANQQEKALRRAKKLQRRREKVRKQQHPSLNGRHDGATTTCQVDLRRVYLPFIQAWLREEIKRILCGVEDALCCDMVSARLEAMRDAQRQVAPAESSEARRRRQEADAAEVRAAEDAATSGTYRTRYWSARE